MVQVKLKRISAGEYIFENDKFLINISSVEPNLFNPNSKLWIGSVLIKSISDGNVTFEAYEDLNTETYLSDMRINIAEFIENN